MATVPQPQPPDEDVRFIYADVAMYCQSCRAISNTNGDCPACAGSRDNLHPLNSWLEREQKTEDRRHEFGGISNGSI